MILPTQFVAQKFYQYCGSPRYNHYNNTYIGSCNICREGKSWLKKQRLYYIPEKNLFYCHNCGYSSSAVNWVIETTKCTYNELQREVDEIDSCDIIEHKKPVVLESPTLPNDCINLFDSNQIEYYKSDKIIQTAINILQQRQLISAINRPAAFYVSLSDFIHKNRLIIPFFNENNKIVHYQSRSLLDNDERARYISKVNSEKTIFNYNNIDSTHESVYIFEGPLDSCFVKNGIAVAGIQEKSQTILTRRQEQQMNKLFAYNKIWVLDSQWNDSTSRNKSDILVELGHKIFIWPENIGRRFKDFNDIAISGHKNSIKTEFIEDNSYYGITAQLQLAKLKRKLM